MDAVKSGLDTLMGGIGDTINTIKTLFSTFLTFSQGDDYGVAMSLAESTWVSTNTIDPTGSNPVVRVHPTLSMEYKYYKSEFTRLLFLTFQALVLGTNGVIDVKKNPVAGLDFDGYLIRLNDISSMFGVSGLQEELFWNRLFPAAQNFQQFIDLGQTPSFNTDIDGTTFAAGVHWTMLVDDRGSEKVYYLPLFDSVMDRGTGFVPFKLSKFNIVRAIELVTKFMPIRVLRELLMQAMSQPFVVDLVKSTLPAILELFVTGNTEIFEKLANLIIRPLIIDPLTKNLDKYMNIADQITSAIISNISSKNYSMEIINDFTTSFLAPLMPSINGIDLGIILDFKDILTSNSLFTVLEKANNLINPLFSIFDSLGSILNIGKIIFGGLIDIFTQIISNTLSEFKSSVI